MLWFELVFCLYSTKTVRACFELICAFFKLAQSVTLITCVREVPDSSLGLKSKHYDCGFCGFPQSLQASVKWLQVREENCAVLNYNAASSCNFFPTFRDSLSVPSSGFKNLGLLTLRLETIRCPETPVTNYHYLLRNNPERCSCQLHRDGSFKSRLRVRSQLWPSTACCLVLYLTTRPSILKYRKRCLSTTKMKIQTSHVAQVAC